MPGALGQSQAHLLILRGPTHPLLQLPRGGRLETEARLDKKRPSPGPVLGVVSACPGVLVP